MLKNKTIWSWALYDWANSAFATTIMAAVLPVYFASVAASGLPPDTRSAVWGFIQTVAAVIVALLAPILGAIADHSSCKKRFLVTFALLGVAASLGLAGTGQNDWILVSIIFVAGAVGFAGANIFYDGFLPEIAPPGKIDRISTIGYALGYVGGGVLLLINMLMMTSPASFGMDQGRLEASIRIETGAGARTDSEAAAVQVRTELLVAAAHLAGGEAGAERAIAQVEREWTTTRSDGADSSYLRIGVDLVPASDRPFSSDALQRAWRERIEPLNEQLAGEAPELNVNVGTASKPITIFNPDQMRAARWSFVTVGVWWLLFSLPLVFFVHEKRRPVEPRDRTYLKIALDRLRGTWHELRRFRELFKFLIAFWLFNDGINTIIKMATIYGGTIGIGSSDLLLALLITQFVGIPCTLLFGNIAEKIGARAGLFIGLWVYLLITIFAVFMDTAWHFYLLAIVVGFVQGGTQALSRSIYGSMVPPDKHAEFFSFYGLSAKFSAILGPFLFAGINIATGSPRLGILSIITFFVAGIAILFFVDIDAGRSAAQAPVGEAPAEQPS